MSTVKKTSNTSNSPILADQPNTSNMSNMFKTFGMSHDAVLRRQVLKEGLLLPLFFEAVWDEVLIPVCLVGVSNDAMWNAVRREQFSEHFSATDRPGHEWRFMGNLGYGGKFWCTGTLNCKVDCYLNDASAETNLIIAEANAKIDEILERFKSLAVKRQGQEISTISRAPKNLKQPSFA